MSRERLPNRRHSITRRFDHGRQRYYGTAGFYADPVRPDQPDLTRPGEIFLDAGKAGTDIQHLARAGAVAVSLALQFGCPLDVLVAALPKLDNGAAADPFGALLMLIGEESGGSS